MPEGEPNAEGGSESAEGEGVGEGTPPASSEDDLSSLSPKELATKFRELRTAHEKLTSTVPDTKALEDLRIESAAWRRLTRSPEFERFVQSLNAEGGEGAGAASSDIASLEEIEELSPESRQKLQKLVDKAIMEKVEPIRTEWSTERTRQYLQGLATKYGKDWERLATHPDQPLAKLMREQGLDAETAFLVTRAREYMERDAAGKAVSAARKNAASDAAVVGNGGGNLRSLVPVASQPRTIEEAFAQAEHTFDRSV
jgi:hypothetical protein